ncbi:MAG: M23 family metallopeptidase [Deltaproteobacteria bacterium]|nr:M23 family metallopeptidase [Deltaproteobacteria bacterium]
MRRRRGLLAFFCTALACTAAVLQLPVLELAEIFSAELPEEYHPLAEAFRSPDAPSAQLGPGAFRQMRLHSLRSQIRADDEIQKLASLHQIPFPILKAHLAQISRGVFDTQGLFWIPDEKELTRDEAAEGAGLEALRDAEGNRKRVSSIAGRLGELRQQTGSTHGALLAWKAGPVRARKALAHASQTTLEADLESIRRHMSDPFRAEAQRWLCTVVALARALDSRWPVRDVASCRQEGQAVLLAAAPGEAVMAPMQAEVGWAGLDGARGLCVEMIHACDMRSEICGLEGVSVTSGQRVHAGAPIGRAGRKQPLLFVYLGVLPLDAASLVPPREQW